MNKKSLRRLKISVYFIVSVLIGIAFAIVDINKLLLSRIFLIQLCAMVVLHEFSHGICAEKNGLMFTAMYIGPFVLERKNGKFKRIKIVGFNGSYLGRANIKNREIRNDEELKSHSEAWKKAIKAGPLSDLIVSIIVVFLGIILKRYELVVSTMIIDIIMCIPSYIYGDGTHLKLMKSDEVFEVSIIYTYSMIAGMSCETEKYLYRRTIETIKNTEINDDNIVSLSIAAQALLYKSVAECSEIDETIKIIIANIYNGKIDRFSNGMDMIYFKSIINTAILYFILVEENLKYAKSLSVYIKNMKCTAPGEKLDKMRSEYILGIKDYESEIKSGKYRNNMFYGCAGFENMENQIDDKIIEYCISKRIYT